MSPSTRFLWLSAILTWSHWNYPWDQEMYVDYNPNAKKIIQVDVKKSSGKLVWLNTSCHPIKQAADIWQDIATRCGQLCPQSFVCHVTNCCYKCCTLTNTLNRTAHRAQALNLCLRETHQVDCICCCAIAGHGELLSHEWLPHTATSCLARAHAI